MIDYGVNTSYFDFFICRAHCLSSRVSRMINMYTFYLNCEGQILDPHPEFIFFIKKGGGGVFGGWAEWNVHTWLLYQDEKSYFCLVRCKACCINAIYKVAMRSLCDFTNFVLPLQSFVHKLQFLSWVCHINLAQRYDTH